MLEFSSTQHSLLSLEQGPNRTAMYTSLSDAFTRIPDIGFMGQLYMVNKLYGDLSRWNINMTTLFVPTDAVSGEEVCHLECWCMCLGAFDLQKPIPWLLMRKYPVCYALSANKFQLEICITSAIARW